MISAEPTVRTAVLSVDASVFDRLAQASTVDELRAVAMEGLPVLIDGANVGRIPGDEFRGLLARALGL